jgi:50S ribosomal subunit-associated GTPase HflX
VDAETSAVTVSGYTGVGVEDLLRRIDTMLPLDPVAVTRFRIPHSDGAALHMLHEYARVIDKRFEEEYYEIVAETPESIRKRLSRFVTSEPDSGA